MANKKQQSIIIITLLLTLCLSGCISQEIPSYPPHVNLKLSPTTAKAPATIQLTADIFDDGTQACNISWNLGDGTIHYESETLTHTYNEPGTYTISIAVTDQDKKTATVNTTLIVTQNIAPNIYIASDKSTARPNSTIQFNVTAHDPDGSIQHYHWDFGDNTTSEDPTTTHSYQNQGTYLVTQTVTDNQGTTTQQSLTINIQENVPPKIHNITCDKNKILLGPARAHFNANCSDSDGTIVSYEWDFDESFPYSLYRQETTGQNISHLFLQAKTYHITLIITDNEGATDTYYKPVTVLTPRSICQIFNETFNKLSKPRFFNVSLIDLLKYFLTNLNLPTN